MTRAVARWLLWAAALTASVLAVARAPLVTDIAAFLPGPATAEQRLLAEQLRDGVAARLVLIGISGEPAAAAAAARALVARLRGDPLFAFATAGEAADLERERARLFEARYLLSPQVVPAAFTADGLRVAFERLQAQLASALAPALRPYAAADPTGELLAVAAQVAPVRSPRIKHGVWFTADGRSAIVLAGTHAPGFDTDAQARAVQALQAHFQALPLAASLTLELAGPGVFAVQSRERIERDAQRLTLIATLLVGGLLWAALRSARFLLLAALPVVTGGVVALAAVAVLFGEIHGITIGFGLTLIGEAVDYALYVHVQRATDAQGQRRLWRALWVAVLTSAAGFLALMLSGFRGLLQLGTFSLVGIVVAGATARFFLPSLLPPLPPLPALRWPPPGAVLRALQLIVAVAVGVAAALLAVRAPALFNDDLSAISPLAAGAGERDARLRGDAGLPQLRWVVALRRATQEQALQAAEALRPLLEAQRAAGALAGFESPADLLPSERTQRARQAALPAPPALRDALRQALAGSAFDPQAFEAFLQAVERTRTGPLLTPAYYADTLLAQRLRAQLLTDADGTTVLVTLHGLEAAAVATLRAALAAQGATLLDLKGDVERLIADYRRSALKAAAAGAALIIVLLALAVRQRQTVLRIVAALAAAVTITAAALVAAAGALTLFHWVALLLVAGVGCNYALFFAQLPHDPAARARVLYSALLAAATTFMAFALLAASGTPVLHMIGVTVAIGVLVALACSAALAAVERSPH